MDYTSYFESSGYTVVKESKGIVVMNKQGKQVLISNALMQQTNKQYLTLMVEEALR